MRRLRPSTAFASGLHDPEGLFYLTRLSAHVGDVEGALALFERVVAGGLYCFPTFARDPWLDGLRAHPEFKRLLGLAESRHREAAAAFRDARGEQVLASVFPSSDSAGRGKPRQNGDAAAHFRTTYQLF